MAMNRFRRLFMAKGQPGSAISFNKPKKNKPKNEKRQKQ